ncbi:MAG: nitrile hydratase accessory protein [Kiloniellaceae bacterium]
MGRLSGPGLSARTAPALPGQPRDDDGPVFREPWEAQAFALTLELFAAGHFTWREWTDTLSAEIRAAQARGDPDLGDTYYRHWLTALERLVADKGLLGADEMTRRKGAWEKAYRRTPHGRPVELVRAGPGGRGA